MVNIFGPANAVQDIGVGIVIGGDQNRGHAHVVGGLKVARNVLEHGGGFWLDVGLPDKFFVGTALGLWNVIGMHDVKNRGTALFEVDGESRELGPGSIVHVESTTPRKFSNVGEDDLVVLVVGGKDGYVERDGHLVDPDRDLERRTAFGS